MNPIDLNDPKLNFSFFNSFKEKQKNLNHSKFSMVLRD